MPHYAEQHRDPLRCKPERIEQIFEDLAWLEITWETPVLRQPDHWRRRPQIVQKRTRRIA